MSSLAVTATTLSSTTAAKEGMDNVVSNVDGMAGIINRYGPTVAILAVFLIIFLVILYFILHTNKKMNEQMIDAQKNASVTNQQMMQEMFDTCMQIIKSNTADDKSDESEEKPKKKSIVSTYIDSSLAFKDASRIAIGKIKCDRIAIYLFHNGNHTPYGYPFAKMSCVHEWNMRGSNTVRGVNHVNIPLYAFSTIVESLVKENEFVVSNIYEHGMLSADEQIFQFISGSTIRSLFALGIKDKDNNLAAFTIAEFKDPQDFSSQEIYDNIKYALSNMNENIYSIVVNDEFRESYNESEDSK